MASVNQICEELIRNVTNSDLDYKMHQTPFSFFFSIRKKVIKNSNFGSSFLPPNPVLTKKFRDELFHVRNEYGNLFHFYQAELDSKKELENQLAALKEEVASKDELLNKLRTEAKKVKDENKTFGGELDAKCVDIKQLKVEVNNLNKDKNALGVGIKTAQKEDREQAKALEKKLEIIEKKVSELEDFRRKKLNEERDERIRRKKELKKEAKKLKNNNGSDNIKQLVVSEVATETKSKLTDKVEDINAHINVNEDHSAEDLGINLEENCNVKEFLVDTSEPIPIQEEVLREEIEADVEEILIEKEDFKQEFKNLSTSSDMIGLDITCLVTTSMDSFTMDTTQVNSVQPLKSLFPPWTCKVCLTDISWGQTWEQKEA